MKEKYYAMKAGVPIDGKPVSRADFTMSVMRFLNTNIYESLLLRLIDKYDSKKKRITLRMSIAIRKTEMRAIWGPKTISARMTTDTQVA